MHIAYMIHLSFCKTSEITKLKIQISKTAEDLENHLIDKNSNNKLFKYINKKANFDLKISKKEIIKLDKIIKQKKIYQHPNIKKIKIKNTITTFRELINFYLKNFYKISERKKIKKLGFKISWCEEYIPVFKRTFKNIKIIFIIRNLKDAINSAQNSQELDQTAIRPLLYYIIYWKKSFHFSQKHKEKILLIKYEDLKIKKQKLSINYLIFVVSKKRK